MRKPNSADRSRARRRGGLPASRSRDVRILRPAGLPVILVAAAGALLLGWLVIQVSAASALLQGSRVAAPAWAADGAEVRLARASEELQLSGDPSDQTVQAAFEAFRRAPLSDVPLLIGARRALAAGRADEADRLIQMAARRDPRSRYTLLLQLDRHVRRGRTAEAAETMGVLTRFFPEVGDFLVGELARLAAEPDSRSAVRDVMETDPQLRTSVLEQLAREGGDPDVILALAGPQAPMAAGAEVPRWQRLLLEGMVERGQVREALPVWSRLAGRDAEARTGAIYDPDFRGLPGPPPFNWRLELGSDGFAERAGAGGLYAQYFGRGNVDLATQMILLDPGAYRISFEVEGEADGEHGLLAWTLTCHPGGRRLVDVPITEVDFAARQLTGDFSVPESDCSSQWLRLVGRAAELPEDQQVTITELQIDGAQR